MPLATQLASRGHQIRIVVPPWDSPSEADSLLLHKGVEVYRVKVRGGPLPTLIRMQRRIKECRPDIIHFVKPRAYAGISQFLAHFLKSLTAMKKPLLILDADDWEQAWTPGLNADPTLARFLAWQEEWGLRNCDAMSVASQWLWRRTRKISPRLPCLYLPNGVEKVDPQAGISPSAEAPILWVTRFVEVSPAWISRFWTHFVTLKPQSRLIVAGSPIEPGLDIPFQSALVQADLAGKNVEFLGMVPYKELQGLYASCGCVIAPAREEAASLSKCSVKLLDSFRYGFMCVASAVGEQARFRGSSSVMFLGPDVSPEEFAVTVALRVQTRQTRYFEGKVNSESLVPNWEFLAMKLEGFYENLLAKIT